MLGLNATQMARIYSKTISKLVRGFADFYSGAETEKAKKCYAGTPLFLVLAVVVLRVVMMIIFGSLALVPTLE